VKETQGICISLESLIWIRRIVGCMSNSVYELKGNRVELLAFANVGLIVSVLLILSNIIWGVSFLHIVLSVLFVGLWGLWFVSNFERSSGA
jgi:hypothetical protein